MQRRTFLLGILATALLRRCGLTTNIPTAIESTTNLPNTTVDGTAMATVHAQYHNNLADSIIAISKPIVGPFLYNVKGYGATGDGSTDDTTAVAAAITAAAVSGGIVYFPPGTYICTKLTLATKVILMGAGPEISIIKLKASSNTALLTTTSFSTADAATGVYACGIVGLTFDGNKANQASNADSGCVQIYGYNWHIEHVKIRNGYSVGLYTNWGSSSSAPGPNGISMEATVHDLEVYSSGTDGIYWNGPHDSRWTAVDTHENGAKGFNIQTRGNALQATNCHSWGTSQTYAWYLNGLTTYLVNCEGEGASVEQVYIAQNQCSIIGGQYFAGGGGTTGIEIANSSTGHQINTLVSNCTTAAIKFTTDGSGSRIDLLVYGTSGSTISGTPASDCYITLYASGGQTPNLGTKKFIGPWVQENVAASQGAGTYLYMLGGENGSATARWNVPMLRTGSITGLIVRSSASRTLGTATITVHKNDVATALTAVLDGTNPTFKGSYSAPGTIAYALGDNIGCFIQTDGSWAPTTADFQILVEISE